MRNEDSKTLIENYKALADSAYEKQKYNEAIKYLSYLLESDSLNGEYFYKRGFCYGTKGELENASKDLLKSVRFGHRLADAYFLLANNEMAFGNDSLAILYLEKSLEINPNDKEAIRALNAIKTAPSLIPKSKSI